MPRKAPVFHFVSELADCAASSEALVIMFSELEQLNEIVPDVLLAELHAKIERGRIRADKSYSLWLPTYGQMVYPYLYLMFEPSPDFRKIGDALARAMTSERLTSIAIETRYLSSLFQVDENSETDSLVFKNFQSLAEGINLANYERLVYQEQHESFSCLEQISLIVGESVANLVEIKDRQASSLLYAEVFAEAVCLARDLTNLPGNYLTPSGLAEEVARISGDFPELVLEILDEQQLAERGMGAICAVGQGSVNPPRLITVEYKGDPDSETVLGLIGKGITFDTGGISLKRSDSMAEMICDMAGAATVIGTMLAVGRLKPRCNVLFVVAAAENMPAGNAYKPGDVITSLSGKTIEVLNTDAEGRVVLADAVTYAKQKGATQLIDVATLTGAILVCLADVATGAVTNNQSFMDELLAASQRADERVWQLPVYPEYKEMIKSSVADVKNTGGRYAGSITGGLFIGTFAEQTPWVHLDIAGTAFLDKRRGIHPKGGTGVMVRSLLELIMDRANRTAH